MDGGNIPAVIQNIIAAAAVNGTDQPSLISKEIGVISGSAI
jgi:hypothetical protein